MTVRIVAGIALLLWAQAKAAPVMPVRPVVPVPAAPAVRPTSPEAAGRDIRVTLAPNRRTLLSAEISARIRRMGVTEGGAFPAGAPLIVFDCSVQEAQLAVAQAALKVADRTLAVRRHQLDQQATGTLDVELAEAEAGKARADVSLLEAQLEKCTIKAPYGGRVAAQRVQEQHYVQPGQELLEIIDDSVLLVEFAVPSRWAGWFRPGSVVQVAIDENGRLYPARVQWTGLPSGTNDSTFSVVAVIIGQQAGLVSGMSGRLVAPALPGTGR